MTDDMDAMMADGLLNTVRECARHLYGENQTYPCDDVKRMAAENERLRAALEAICMMDISWVGDAWKLKDIARAALEDMYHAAAIRAMIPSGKDQ